jgi:hypothetical protein
MMSVNSCGQRTATMTPSMRAAQRSAESHQQHRPVPGAVRRVGRGAGGEHQAQHAGHRGAGLAARPDALRPCDPLDDHGQARVAQVERAAGQQMGGADRREMHADRADGKATVARESLIGAADERFTAEAVAPSLEASPGPSGRRGGTVLPVRPRGRRRRAR